MIVYTDLENDKVQIDIEKDSKLVFLQLASKD
jgi:hypothetical protein